MAFSLPLVFSSARILRPSCLRIKTHALKPLIINPEVSLPPPPGVPNIMTNTNSTHPSSLYPRFLINPAPFSSLVSPYTAKPVIDTTLLDTTSFSTDDEGTEDTSVEDAYVNPFLTEGLPYPAMVNDYFDDAAALYARIDMPGVSKEGVKLWLELDKSILNIEGKESKKDLDECSEEDESGLRRYGAGLFLAPGIYKLDQIKASMRDGVFRVMVPKVKIEEKPGVVLLEVN